MPLEDNIPARLRSRFEVYEWRHASAILTRDFPEEWQDILDVLSDFRLRRSDVAKAGGRKSPISGSLDHRFYERAGRRRNSTPRSPWTR